MALRLSRTRPSIRNANILVLRTSPESCRILHQSPRRTFIAEAVHASHSALQSVHELSGLPWALSIPLFALLFRTTFVLPLSIYQRRVAQRQVELQPLIESWRYPLEKEAMKKYGHLGPQVTEQALMTSLKKKREEIYKRYKCGFWKNWLGLAQLPFFLTIMEALRNMTGSTQGWIGMMIGKDVAAGVEDVGASITGDGLIAEAIRIPTEPSLATEGILWFPDLLVADPQLILPFMLSGTIFLNIYGGFGKSQDKALSKWQLRIKRNLGLVALAIGPIMMHVPSGMLIYWISSSGLNLLQAMVLERVMPIKSQPKPCKPKRPWRTGLGLPSEQLKS